MDVNIEEWKTLLIKGNPPSQLRKTLFDLPNQRVIKTDVLRTKTGLLTDKEMHDLEWLLTSYCKDTNTSYKQGMNEIFVTFLLLKRQNVDLNTIYELIKNFIDVCLINMFKDADFRPAQAMFLIIKLLLKYQNPQLFNFLHQFSIGPELYATSWFLTLFATKIVNPELVFYLWKEIILEKDTVFPCYLAVALLGLNEGFVRGKQFPNAAQAIGRIQVKTFDEVKTWVCAARTIKDELPVSWKFAINNYDIHNLQTIDSVILNLIGEISVSVYPREILPMLYPNFNCSCNGSCFWCRNCKNSRDFIIFDCRSESELQGGILPSTEVFNNRHWKNPYVLMEYVNNFDSLKGKKHFVLMCSAELTNKNYDINQEIPPASSQDMLMALMQAFIMNEFPHVSIAHGGFKACHDLAERFKLEIFEHARDYCQVCTPDKPKTGFKKFTKSMSEVLRTTIGKVSMSFSGYKPTQPSILNEIKDYSNSKSYICRKFDKATYDQSDEEFSLLITKEQVILARFANSQPKKVIKVMEDMPMVDLLKITSMKKFPKVLTFCTTSKQICLIFADIKESKECISLVTKYFRELKSS